MKCISSTFKYQDIVQAQEKQQRKKGFVGPSAVTSNCTILSHTAEVLYQVEGSNLPDGAWVGGDAWFGSITTAADVHKRFSVESIWVVKKYILVSNGSTSCDDKTIGNTTQSNTLYRSQLKGEFGGVGRKDIPQPELADFLYQYLPLIDEHDKQHQSILNLKQCWPTRNPWFALLTTLTCLYLLDFHCLNIHHKRKYNKQYIPCGVRNFADLICHTLNNELQGWYKFQQQWITNHTNVDDHLQCIKNFIGETERAPAEKQLAMNWNKGNPFTKQCYVCCMFL